MMQKIWRKVSALLIVLVMPSIVIANDQPEPLNIEESLPVQLHHSCREIFKHHSCKCKDPNDSYALTLWLLNTNYLKEAFEHVTFPSQGNESFIITRELVENALNINNLYQKQTNIRDIQRIMVKQVFFLYAYVFSLRLNFDVSALDQKLLSTNNDLAIAFKKALKLDKSKIPRLKRALSKRLISLKELGEAYVAAYSGDDFENVYIKYDQALRSATSLEKLLNIYIKQD